MPFRQRSRALAYSTTNARLRSSASIRAHLHRVATRGRRFRRGSTLAGDARHDCAHTARRPNTRRPVRARSAARSGERTRTGLILRSGESCAPAAWRRRHHGVTSVHRLTSRPHGGPATAVAVGRPRGLAEQSADVRARPANPRYPEGIGTVSATLFSDLDERTRSGLEHWHSGQSEAQPGNWRWALRTVRGRSQATRGRPDSPSSASGRSRQSSS